MRVLLITALFAALLAASPALAGPAVSDALQTCDRLASAPQEPWHEWAGVIDAHLDTTAALPACTAALAEHPDSPALNYRVGRTLALVGRLQQAIPLTTKSAGAGFAPAEAVLGTRLILGEGMAQNLTAGNLWLMLAAAQGNAIGELNLGLGYHEATGLPHDDHAALYWIGRSAAQGYGLAEQELGCAAYQCPYQATTRDPVKAVAWLRRAAAKHLPHAQALLAWHLFYGVGTAPDLPAAAKLDAKAAAAGDVMGTGWLAYSYSGGYGVPQSFGESSRLYRLCADGGDANCMYNVGLDFEFGRGHDANAPLAVDWYRKAADAGCTCGMYRLGIAYESGDGVAQDVGKAETWYRKAAFAGNGDAQAALASFYSRSGYYHPVDAAFWAQRAADNGRFDAETRLAATFFASGDIDRAKDFATRALQGDADDRRTAEELLNMIGGLTVRPLSIRTK